MLRIILGRAHSGKTARVISEISSRVTNRTGYTYYIVPEQYSHEAERELCRHAGDTLALYAETTSFSRLYYNLASELGGGATRFLDGGGKLLALASACDDVSSRLRTLGRGRLKPEAFSELMATMDEFASARITPEAVEAAALASGGVLADKLRELYLIFEAYKAVCARGEADPGTVIDRLAELVPRSAAMRGASAYIDGFVDFTEQEYAVIEAMLLVCGDMCLCLTCDGLGPGNEVHDLSRRAARRIIDIARSRAIEAEIEEVEAPASESPFVFLEERLFAYTDEAMDSGGAVRLFKAPSRVAECELAASEALRLVRETGCRFRDISVVARGFDSYRPALAAVFEYYDVPLYMSRRSGLGEKPLPAFIKRAFEVISGGWEGQAVCEYLRTSLAGISPGDCDALENYIYMWNIKGAGFLSASDWALHPRGLGKELLDADVQALERINSLREKISAPLIALSERSRRAETAGEHASALSAFLAEAGLPETLAELTERLSGSGRAALASEYGQIWDIVVGAIEQFALMLGGSHMTQDEFFRLFLLVLNQYSVGTIPQALDSVTAGDMDRMRRRSIRHLIVLGATDDRLPANAATGGMLSEMERAALAESGLQLPLSGDDGFFRELNLIYNCLTMPSETLTMCCGGASSDGEESAPSYIFERVARLFSIEVREADAMRLRSSAPRPALELAVSAELTGASAPELAAREYFMAEPEAERIGAMSKAAAMGRGRLSESAVELLYGGVARLSSSRAEEFASCRFRYFMDYGLRAEPRRRAEFSAPEAGTFIHYLLENTTREIMDGAGFENADAELITALVDKYIDLYARERLSSRLEDDSRFAYLFSRLALSGRRIVEDTVNELARSDFRPLCFELTFGGELRVRLGGEDGVYLAGRVDRVDGYRRDGVLYVRVVDYKSGKKNFALRDVLNGLNMQMLLYLFAIEQSGQEIFGEPCVPAGVLYVPSRDAFIVTAKRGESDESLERERKKALRRHGLLIDNPDILSAMERGEDISYLPYDGRSHRIDPSSLAGGEQLKSLRGFIEETLAGLRGGICGGHIEANPMNPEELCGYCDFADACRFDAERDEPRFSPKLGIDEVWDIIGGCIE